MTALPRPTALVADPQSSASLRVLCALHYKGLDLPLQALRLRAGEHRLEAHRALNPSQAVPVLMLDGGEVITQSMAILEYLEACVPEPALMPTDAVLAARVRGLCGLIAADIHPLTNMRVRQHLSATAGEAASQDWVRHWSRDAQAALEGWLQRWAGQHAIGDRPTMADFFLAPAVFSMLRLGCPPQPGSRLAEVYQQALALPAFARLRPAAALPAT